MDRFDPERRVALVMDEWGTWFDVEPGTNPGFLYQQNTMRDALVAAVHLNMFNNHAERLRMANIAQTINVLQAVILTEGPKMVLTPTYHVFDLFKGHQDAVMLPVLVESEDGGGFPLVSASASIDDSETVLITLTNSDPSGEQPARLELRGATLGSTVKLTGEVLTAETMQAHNTFSKGDAVKPEKFDGAAIDRGVITATLPARSVAALRIG
jgi:alpha-N-arabinofuranosidase